MVQWSWTVCRGKGFNYSTQVYCLHSPQSDGIKEDGFEMGEHPLESSAAPVFSSYINALNHRAKCTLSLNDFHLKEAKAPANQGTRTNPPASQVWRAR